MPDTQPIDIRDAPYGWTTADPAAVERARTDGGSRAAIARALWRLGEQPGAEAQIGGYVYEIADGAVAGLEQQGLIIVRADDPRAVTQEALVPLNTRLTFAEAAIARVRAYHEEHEGRCVRCLERCDCFEDAPQTPEGLWDAWSKTCGHGNEPYPCPTIRALDGPAVSEEQTGPTTTEGTDHA